MPLFKKSPSDTGTMSEAHRKVLHRCRMLLVKDLDITDVLENMTSDEGFKPEVKDHIMSFPTREQRVGIFLDKLELRGDRAFSLFAESVKDKYKHVHYVLEETLRTIDDLQDSHHQDRSAVTGDTVRKLLRNKLKHKSQSHGSESADMDLDMVVSDNSGDEYIDCYTIPMRGRLQRESWIKHEVEPKTEECEQTDESSFMASLVKDLNFQRIDPSSIPNEVKSPPNYCTVFVVDNTDNSTGAITRNEKVNMEVGVSEDQEVIDGSSSNNFQDIIERQRKAVEKEKCNSLPDIAAPPVPPKPEHLPSLSITAKPKSVRSQIKNIEEAGSPLQPPPRTTSKNPGEKPRPLPKPKHKAEKGQKTTKENEADWNDGPPLPPRGFQIPTLNVPPEIPSHDTCDTETNKRCVPAPELSSMRDRSLSNVTEESTSKTDDEITDVPADNETAQTAQMSNGNSTEDAHDTLLNESQDSDHTLTYTKEKVVEEIAQPKQDEVYEPVGIAPKLLETNLDEDSDDPLSCHVEVGSGWYDDDKRSGSVSLNGTAAGQSRESSPEDQELPDPSGSSKTSGDSICSTNPGSIGEKSSLADSSDNMVFPEGKLSQRGGKASRPPMLLPRVLSELHAQGDNESSEETSYYEDIEIFDKASSPSGKSNMYLDPKSFGKNLEGRDSVFFEPSPQLSLTGKGVQFSSWEITGKLRLQRHELLIADVEESMEHSSVTSESNDTEDTGVDGDQYAKFTNTKLAFDKEGHAYYVPSALLKKYGNPEGEPWFYPVEMSSRQATLFLSMEQQEGCFIVYRSRRKMPGIAYNLSLCRENGDVVHYHVVENLHGDVMIEGHDHSFMNIRDLVQYFQRNKSQLASRLRRPLKEARMPVTPGYHYNIQYEINRHNLNLTGKIIGKGNFGVVCAGMYQRIHVAVKVLQKADATVMEEDDFVEEAKVMMGLKHDHVVRLIGISCTARPFFLVTEYVARGNLRDCLRNKVIPLDNIDSLFDICIQVTAAMYYLESIKYVLHRDVAARNFLVASDMCVKLADFGRAHYVMDDYYQAPRTENIAIKWAAPEVLLDSIYSTRSDVWSLGIVFWEVFSAGERPYTSLSGEQTAVYVCEGGRLDKPPGCAPDLAAMMKSCWRENPDERPSFATLYDKLKSKSSIYYAGPSRGRNKKRNSSLEPVNRTNSNSNSPAPPKIKSPHRPLTPTRKHKKTIVLDSKAEEYVQEVFSQQGEEAKRQSGERLHTSSSETSLVSAQGVLDPTKDDLTRGNKIRKSLRNLIKKPKRKGSKLDNLKDGENGPKSPQPSSGGQVYYA